MPPSPMRRTIRYRPASAAPTSGSKVSARLEAGAADAIAAPEVPLTTVAESRNARPAAAAEDGDDDGDEDGDNDGSNDAPAALASGASTGTRRTPSRGHVAVPSGKASPQTGQEAIAIGAQSSSPRDGG